MDRFVTSLTIAALLAVSGSAGPIHSEYGVPFDTYGPPPASETHSPQHRSLDLPPIELPPPVDRFFLSEEFPPQTLREEIELAPVELPPPIEKIIISERPIRPVEYVSDLAPIELPPPLKIVAPEEFPIVRHGVELLPIELPPPVEILTRSKIPTHVSKSNSRVPEFVRKELKPEISTRGGEILAPPNTKVHITDEKNQYSVGFQNPDGTEVNEQGRLISTDNGWEYVIAKTGSYSYVSPEGTPVHVEWVADEKGFRILNADA